MERPVGRGRVLDLRRARVRRAHQHEAAGARGKRSLDQRLQRVAPQERVGRDRIHPGTRCAEIGLRVRLRRHRHVAALAVAEHEVPAVGRVRRHLRERGPSGRAQPLEAGELELDAHAGLPHRVDRGAAVPRDRGGGGVGPACLRPQRRRVGVEPEQHLAAALLDPRRQAVREAGVHAFGPTRRRFAGLCGLSSPRSAGPACGYPPKPPPGAPPPGAPAPLLTAFLSDEPALKRGTRLAAIWIRSPVWGFTP